MAYPTVAALVAASSGDARAALDALDDAQKDSLYRAAIVAVEETCKQSFAGATVEAKRLDGNGSDLLYLPRRLARIDAIEVRGSALAATDVEVSEQGDSLKLLSWQGGSAYARAMATVDPDWSPHRRAFVEGRGTVTVTGLWGWEECPDGVALALRYDMEDNALADSHALAASIHAYRTLGLRDIRQGNLSASVQDQPGISTRVARELRPHVWRARPRTV